ncbi:MAG: hypothetical protein WD046_07925 [Paracoccaceae bacterium]
MSHLPIAAFFCKVQRDEIVLYVQPVPDMEPADYVELIKSRFANSKNRDTSRRVAFDGASRHPGFVLPILRDALGAHGPIEGLSLVEALWARMCAGTREHGTAIEANDPLWTQLVEAAQAARENPMAWLKQQQIYGDLADNAAFAASFTRWLGLIWQQGCEATVKAYIAQ